MNSGDNYLDIHRPTRLQSNFSYTFNGSEPAGTYRWLGAFVEPGTPLNLISDITQPSFEFR